MDEKSEKSLQEQTCVRSRWCTTDAKFKRNMKWSHQEKAFYYFIQSHPIIINPFIVI